MDASPKGAVGPAVPARPPPVKNEPAEELIPTQQLPPNGVPRAAPGLLERFQSDRAFALLAVTAVSLLAVAGCGVVALWRSPAFATEMVQHLGGTICLPIAGIGLGALVLTLDRRDRRMGKTTLKIARLELEGAVGPIFLWSIALVCYALCLRLVWG